MSSMSEERVPLDEHVENLNQLVEDFDPAIEDFLNQGEWVESEGGDLEGVEVEGSEDVNRAEVEVMKDNSGLSYPPEEVDEDEEEEERDDFFSKVLGGEADLEQLEEAYNEDIKQLNNHAEGSMGQTGGSELYDRDPDHIELVWDSDENEHPIETINWDEYDSVEEKEEAEPTEEVRTTPPQAAHVLENEPETEGTMPQSGEGKQGNGETSRTVADWHGPPTEETADSALPEEVMLFLGENAEVSSEEGGLLSEMVEGASDKSVADSQRAEPGETPSDTAPRDSALHKSAEKEFGDVLMQAPLSALEVKNEEQHRKAKSSLQENTEPEQGSGTSEQDCLVEDSASEDTEQTAGAGKGEEGDEGEAQVPEPARREGENAPLTEQASSSDVVPKDTSEPVEEGMGQGPAHASLLLTEEGAPEVKFLPVDNGTGVEKEGTVEAVQASVSASESDAEQNENDKDGSDGKGQKVVTQVPAEDARLSEKSQGVKERNAAAVDEADEAIGERNVPEGPEEAEPEVDGSGDEAEKFAEQAEGGDLEMPSALPEDQRVLGEGEHVQSPLEAAALEQESEEVVESQDVVQVEPAAAQKPTAPVTQGPTSSDNEPKLVEEKGAVKEAEELDEASSSLQFEVEPKAVASRQSVLEESMEQLAPEETSPDLFAEEIGDDKLPQSTAQAVEMPNQSAAESEQEPRADQEQSLHQEPESFGEEGQQVSAEEAEHSGAQQEGLGSEARAPEPAEQSDKMLEKQEKDLPRVQRREESEEVLELETAGGGEEGSQLGEGSQPEPDERQGSGSQSAQVEDVMQLGSEEMSEAVDQSGSGTLPPVAEAEGKSDGEPEEEQEDVIDVSHASGLEPPSCSNAVESNEPLEDEQEASAEDSALGKSDHGTMEELEVEAGASEAGIGEASQGPEEVSSPEDVATVLEATETRERGGLKDGSKAEGREENALAQKEEPASSPGAEASDREEFKSATVQGLPEEDSVNGSAAADESTEAEDRQSEAPATDHDQVSSGEAEGESKEETTREHEERVNAAMGRDEPEEDSLLVLESQADLNEPEDVKAVAVQEVEGLAPLPAHDSAEALAPKTEEKEQGTPAAAAEEQATATVPDVSKRKDKDQEDSESPAAEVNLSGWLISKLKALCLEHGVNPAGFIEKAELVAAASEALRKAKDGANGLPSKVIEKDGKLEGDVNVKAAVVEESSGLPQAEETAAGKEVENSTTALADTGKEREEGEALRKPVKAQETQISEETPATDESHRGKPAVQGTAAPEAGPVEDREVPAQQTHEAAKAAKEEHAQTAPKEQKAPSAEVPVSGAEEDLSGWSVGRLKAFLLANDLNPALFIEKREMLAAARKIKQRGCAVNVPLEAPSKTKEATATGSAQSSPTHNEVAKLAAKETAASSVVDEVAGDRPVQETSQGDSSMLGRTSDGAAGGAPAIEQEIPIIEQEKSSAVLSREGEQQASHIEGDVAAVLKASGTEPALAEGLPAVDKTKAQLQQELEQGSKQKAHSLLQAVSEEGPEEVETKVADAKDAHLAQAAEAAPFSDLKHEAEAGSATVTPEQETEASEEVPEEGTEGEAVWEAQVEAREAATWLEPVLADATVEDTAKQPAVVGPMEDEAEAQTRSEAGPELEHEPTSEAGSEPQVEPRPEAGFDQPIEPRSLAQSDQCMEPSSDGSLELEIEPSSEARSNHMQANAEARFEPESKLGSEAKQEAEDEPRMETWSTSESKPDSKATSEVENQPSLEAWSEPGEDAGSESEAEELGKAGQELFDSPTSVVEQHLKEFEKEQRQRSRMGPQGLAAAAEGPEHGPVRRAEYEGTRGVVARAVTVARSSGDSKKGSHSPRELEGTERLLACESLSEDVKTATRRRNSFDLLPYQDHAESALEATKARRRSLDVLPSSQASALHDGAPPTTSRTLLPSESLRLKHVLQRIGQKLTEAGPSSTAEAEAAVGKPAAVEVWKDIECVAEGEPKQEEAEAELLQQQQPWTEEEAQQQVEEEEPKQEAEGWLEPVVAAEAEPEAEKGLEGAAAVTAGIPTEGGADTQSAASLPEVGASTEESKEEVLPPDGRQEESAPQVSEPQTLEGAAEQGPARSCDREFVKPTLSLPATPRPLPISRLVDEAVAEALQFDSPRSEASAESSPRWKVALEGGVKKSPRLLRVLEQVEAKLARQTEEERGRPSPLGGGKSSPGVEGSSAGAAREEAASKVDQAAKPVQSSRAIDPPPVSVTTTPAPPSSRPRKVSSAPNLSGKPPLPEAPRKRRAEKKVALEVAQDQGSDQWEVTPVRATEVEPIQDEEAKQDNRPKVLVKVQEVIKEKVDKVGVPVFGSVVLGVVVLGGWLVVALRRGRKRGAKLERYIKERPSLGVEDV